MNKKKKAILLSVLAIAVLLAVWISRSGKENGTGQTLLAGTGEVREESYQAYLDANQYEGTLAKAEVAVDLYDYTLSEQMTAEQVDGGLLTGEEGSITWNFTVEESGFYQLKLSYIPAKGTTSDIQRSLYLDGTLCYDALSQIVLKRLYSDEEIRVKNENEIRPSAEEIFTEQEVFLEDYKRRSNEPLLFYLAAGSHTITFEALKEPVVYTGLTFCAAKESPAYAEALEVLKSQYAVYDGDTVICQAERNEGNTTAIYKSSTSINIQKNYSDSKLVPYHPYHILYNTIGGDGYSMPGDFITWEIEAPKEGLYTLTFKGRQNSKRGVTSYRKLYVNGTVPYAEMEQLAFDYQSDMTNYTLSDENGEPYLFYLKEGSNTITLEVVLGEFGSVLTQVEESMYQLNQLYLKTVQITGTVPSKYIDYEIRKKVPNFAETMEAESKRLAEVCEQLVSITGEKGEYTSLIEKMSIQAEGLAKDPESVVKELNQWKDNLAALGTWMVSISKMPLELDSLMLAAPEGELPKAKDGVLASAWYGTVRFFASFFIDQSQISDESQAKEKEVLTVWMASSGKEQAQILQNMIDETFVPETDIAVNLQLIPVGVVLRAALAGNGPDVIVGLSQTTLSDFAMRNALVDLSELEGFEEEAARYAQSAIDGASYQDGVYGLAEQEKFMMLFYRKDILNSLGLSVPDTWEEVKEMIPELQKNNYDFYLPNASFYPSVLFQYGGDLYQGTGNDYGIASALSSDIAMESFKEFTDFFTCYKLQVSVDFSNRFRTGEIPIGITDYTTYCQLEIFAPEIKGLWGFAPIPGVEKEDGSIDRTYISDTVQSVIMKNCDRTEDAWTFLKWWTSAEVQLQYANTLESVMGTAARYPAADKEVLTQLPWSNEEIKQLLTQLENTKGLPAVPGHYMTTRMIQYAFNNVVADSANPRETLYLNMKSIDKELLKKRAEFSLSLE